ncbi:putative clathrin assembly protein At5g35200 [Hibiscus syriacus]|uniref:putative clathrin assembly protein At5g35200 n=1 Tax=Hibiscus syriacus TaxID=106335 RepID=UPI00192162AE|nr:putative clathrin assembly protein At5g35200 [Hibiscus syriacus]
MFGGSKQSRLRKALGAIKDTTTVSLAKVHSEYKELDIAMVKATDHYERPAKEKYVKAILAAVSATRPRADVAYCIYALARRLSRTRNWVVALKTLIVIHRALREVDPTFHEEFINYGRSRRHMLNLSHFKDDSSCTTWDYSAWVRSYALFLEDRLECFRILKYDIEMIGPRTKGLDTAEALEQLTALQQLLFRVLGCQPIGAAAHNLVIQLALSLVALESVNIYRALSDGTINLMDKFFGMDRPDAMRALNIYRRSRYQEEGLSEFYEVCKRLYIGRGDMYIKIEQPPASFLQAMEDYVNEAAQASTVRKDQQIENPKKVLAVACKKAPEVEQWSSPPLPEPEEAEKVEEPMVEPLDLLGLNNPAPVASKLDGKNALELAIVPQTNSPAASFQANGTTGWELELVTAPSSNDNATATYKMGGGFDKFMLDSLYEDALIQCGYQKVSYNPWEPPPTCNVMMHDRFYGSNTVAVSPSVQMSTAANQHQAFMLQKPMMKMLGPQQPPSNSFGYPYGASVHPYYSGMSVQPYTGLI